MDGPAAARRGEALLDGPRERGVKDAWTTQSTTADVTTRLNNDGGNAEWIGTMALSILWTHGAPQAT